ncbi:MAG: HAD hydrolase-like protein, partial [Clostridiales bacterium]|nr:HAD hydrolase-like protein [Clostridiales bacterium]
MDGTLTDSMSAWADLYGMLFDQIGIAMPSDFLMAVNHLPMQRRVDMLADRYSLNIDVAEVYDAWFKEVYRYYLNVFKVKPYTLAALKTLKKAGICSAVATASDKRLVEAFVCGNSLDGYFDAITDLTEVSAPKS